MKRYIVTNVESISFANARVKWVTVNKHDHLATPPHTKVRWEEKNELTEADEVNKTPHWAIQESIADFLSRVTGEKIVRPGHKAFDVNAKTFKVIRAPYTEHYTSLAFEIVT